jgi:hypothetical protein
VAYKLSQRHQLRRIGYSEQDDPNRINLGSVATVFILFGLLGLITAWFYSGESVKVIHNAYYPQKSEPYKEFGPIVVAEEDAVYRIKVRAYLAQQSWSFVEGEVLNEEREYLFSFGKELSHYSGSDWSEVDNDYTIKITFPATGKYYLRFKAESSRTPKSIAVEVHSQVGSGVPHFWFGIITLIIGIILNEIHNRTVITVFKVLDRYS